MQFIPLDPRDAQLDVLADAVAAPEGAIDALRELTGNPPPTSLDDLTNEDTFVSILSVDAAVALGIPFGCADAKYSRRIVVQEYLKFRELQEGQTRTRWGVGVRWVVNVNVLNTQAKISSVPMIAASAQVGFVEATARFQVLGISAAEVTKAIPAPTDLNTETYVELKQSLLKIKDLIYDQATTVTPQVLAILGEIRVPSERAYESALATGWALTKIAQEKSLARAQAEYKKASAFFRDEVKAVYIDIVGSSEENAPISDEVKARAKRLLGDLSVRD